MEKIWKVSHTDRERWRDAHRFEHWYKNNAVYFITSKTRDGYLAFKSHAACEVFWDRFNHYTGARG